MIAEQRSAASGAGGKRFAGQSAIVTGAASGLGLGIAKRLFREGAQLSLWDCNPAALDSAAACLGGAHTVTVDVMDPAAVERATQNTVDALRPSDLLTIMKPTSLRYSMGCKAIPLVATLAGFFGAAILSRAQQNFDRVEVQTQPVQGNVYMLIGAGGNVTVQTGPDGVVIVDTQFEPMAPKLLAAIRKLSDKPIRYIINTHVHPDHTGGNAAIAQAGVPPADGGGSVAGQGARIIAHENVLKMMSMPKTGKQFDFSAPKERWPTETYTNRKTIQFNGEQIELVHVEQAHSTGDTIVFFHGSNVVSAGDVYAINRYPSYDPQGTIDGMIAGLDRIIEMIAPPDKQGQGGTAIIPGHGRITRQPELVAYRDMSMTIRDRVRDMVNKGMTLEQVKAAKPVKEYEPVYGGNTGVSSTDFVLDEIYKDLSQNK